MSVRVSVNGLPAMRITPRDFEALLCGLLLWEGGCDVRVTGIVEAA